MDHRHSSSTARSNNFSNPNDEYRPRLNPTAAEFIPGIQLSGESINNSSSNQKQKGKTKRENDNLRTTLSDRLRNETYECMICCDRVRWSHPVWSCQLCFSVYHLRCVKKWATSCSGMQQDSSSNFLSSDWRCPGCQSVNQDVPNDYKCFCGKMKNPNYASSAQRGHSAPHTCGELCQKQKGGGGSNDCPHACNLLCHPGPCDLCPLTMDKRCLCGKETRRVRCGSEDFQCGQICGKLLNCSSHECQRVCHAGDCAPCSETLVQDCFCGHSQRQILCGDTKTNKNELYSCGIVCDKLYQCQIHHCTQKCHQGGCGICPFDPTLIKNCCCGKRAIEDLEIIRNSCNDSLPICENNCGKTLECGEEGNRHSCSSQCHPGTCPICPLNMSVRCRCGGTLKNISCAELGQYDVDHPLLCDRRCSKKRSCKQHKCGELCCVDREHFCTLICGRKLSCGVHTCDALCHGGKCRPCLHASFDELICLCGASIIYPPVRCGTKPPLCDKQCTRSHSCQHPVAHNCHSDPNCPPCTYLTEKLCYGKHEMRKNIPCYLNDVSCGRACGLALPCGQHTCNRNCHPGDCLSESEQCNQPCVRPKSTCGHPCASKCHGDSTCPEEKRCDFLVKVTCKCGHQVNHMSCFEIDRLLTQRFMGKAAKADVKNELNLVELTRQDSMERYKCLDCTDECARIERNRRFAEALDIKTDDLVGDLGPPVYTDFLKEQFRLCPDFILGVEKAMCDLVTSAEKSKQASRSHVFAPMTRNQRHIVHEYAPYLEIDTVAYDQEPQRNVVATAKRGKSKIPSILLSTVVQKENTKPVNRVVPPKANQGEMVNSPMNMKTLQLAPGTVLRR